MALSLTGYFIAQPDNHIDTGEKVLAGRANMPESEHAGVRLTREQAAAANALLGAFRNGRKN
jgi:hypothetical protein